MYRPLETLLKKTPIASTMAFSCVVFFASLGSVQAQSFNVPENGTLTGIRVLNPGETGVVGSGGVLQASFGGWRGGLRECLFQNIKK